MNVLSLLIAHFTGDPPATDWLDLLGRSVMAGMILGGMILFIVAVMRYQPPKDRAMSRCVVVKAMSAEGEELGSESVYMDGFGSSGGRFTNLEMGGTHSMEPNKVKVYLNSLPEGTTHLGITVE